MMNLDMTGLTITRAISRTKKRCGHCAKNIRNGCSKHGFGIHDHYFPEWYCVVWYCVTLKYN